MNLLVDCGRIFVSKNYPLYAIGVNTVNDAYIMNGDWQSFDMISPGIPFVLKVYNTVMKSGRAVLKFIVRFDTCTMLLI